MKKLTALTIFIFTILFSFTITAQQMRAFRGNYNTNFPKKIMKPMGNPLPAGTYIIGTVGDFPTIDSAFNKLSVDGIAGPVTLELIDTLYTAPSDSNGFLLNGPITGADQNNRVTIKPAESRNVTIQGSGHRVLTFMNISYLTIDGIGLSGTTTLTTHALFNSQFSYNDAVDFINNSDHNIVQNITAITEDYKRLSLGIGFWTTYYQGTAAPDSNLIYNNFVKKAAWGIFIQGYKNQKAQGNIIRGNYVGSETDSLIDWGIQLTGCQNTLVENNIVQNLKFTFNIQGDEINVGINSYVGNADTIRNNIVHNIKSSAGYTSTGIMLSGGSDGMGNNDIVYNNMVYDIQSSSAVSNSRVAGIQMWYQNNPKVYFNSVNLTGKGSNRSGSAALYIYGTCSNVEAKNNILVNTRDESPSFASSICDVTTSNLVSDNNDLYYDSNQLNCLVNAGGIKYNTLSDWQAKGKDLLSISEMPNFKAPYLHIDESIPTSLEKRGTPIPSINVDFDGDTRDANLPDIGGDEFNGKIAQGPLMSGYSVGTNGYFPTIDSAFNRLSTDGVSGPVTLELIDTLYTAPTDSSGFLLNGPIPGADQNNRVTIEPAEKKHVTIQGDAKRLLVFMNTSFVTIDGIGLNGNTTLTIHALESQFTYTSGVDFTDNSDHNIIQHITVINENYNHISLGIGCLTSNQQVTTTPDNNLIYNNFIKKADWGILIQGPANQKPSGNIIRENYVGSETDSLIDWGIQLTGCQKTLVENNIVQNLKITLNIGGDEINVGINSYAGNEDTIRNNIVHNIKSSAGYTSTGILLSGTSNEKGNNDIVYNNMVYDIQSTSTEADSRVTGIQMWDQNNPKIYYNSVYLSGKGSSPYGSAALYIDYCSNVKAENNILVNTRDESPYCASDIYDYTTSELVSNNNDLYCVEDQYNCLARISSSEYTTLASWQSKGEGMNSITEMPSFKAPDLHIDESIPTNLESHGIPIAGIDVDIDGDARGTDSTDIGADEFNGKTIVGVNDKVTQPIVYNLEQNYPNPFNPTTTIKYSIPKQSHVTLKVYDILGREVATLVNAEKPAGNYEVEFSTVSGIRNLASGIFFYQIKAGDYVCTKKMILLK